MTGSESVSPYGADLPRSGRRPGFDAYPGELRTPGPAVATAIPMLRIRGMSKRFGRALVLDDVEITVGKGEIHGLLGANGSGKSTLIKILAGFHEPEGEPEVVVDGKRVSFPMAVDTPRHYGFSFVHQDLGLITSLTVADNLAIGGATYGPGSSLHRRPRRERAAMAAVLSRYGVSIDPWSRIDELSQVDRALVAIVRAVEEIRTGSGLGVLVLDEPSASLPLASKAQLADLVRQVAAAGHGVIFVSHDLSEVVGLCHCVTVLRDGRVAADQRMEDVVVDDLIALIAGDERQVTGTASTTTKNVAGSARRDASVAHGCPDLEAKASPVFALRNVEGGGLHGLDLAIAPGEIVGAAGLLGAGHDSLPYLAFGALPNVRGTLAVGGASLDVRRFDPVRAVAHGMALVPGNRQQDGIVADLPVAENIALPALHRHVHGLVLLRSAIERAVTPLLDRFAVKPADPGMLAGHLSGGNQQRCVLAKWARDNVRVVLMHEPTQGVDVGARAQIHEIVRRMAAGGVAFLVASSDHDELATLCDRVIVLRHGVQVNELHGPGLTKEEVTSACLQTI